MIQKVFYDYACEMVAKRRELISIKVKLELNHKNNANVSDLYSLFDDSSVSSGEIGAKDLKLFIHLYGRYLDKNTRGRSRPAVTHKM